MVKVKFLCLLVALSGMLTCRAQNDRDVWAYIERYKEAALANERDYGIPAPIILAQGILESGAGKSRLTLSSNNHFGIKALGGWKGPVHMAKDDEPGLSRFRVYASAAESYRDHARVLKGSARYRALFNYSVYDYRRWAYGLKKAGYATAPKYAEALIGYIERYRLYNINGGAKLRPGKTVVITRYENVRVPVFAADVVMPDSVISEEENLIEEAVQHFLVEVNDVRCTVIQPGEDIHAIVRKYDIPMQDILKFNEVGSSRLFEEGDIVFLEMKKKKYEGSQDKYIARGDENLYSVSQKFGVRVRHLARLNGLGEYAVLSSGQQINLK